MPMHMPFLGPVQTASLQSQGQKRGLCWRRFSYFTVMNMEQRHASFPRRSSATKAGCLIPSRVLAALASKVRKSLTLHTERLLINDATIHSFDIYCESDAGNRAAYWDLKVSTAQLLRGGRVSVKDLTNDEQQRGEVCGTPFLLHSSAHATPKVSPCSTISEKEAVCLTSSCKGYPWQRFLHLIPAPPVLNLWLELGHCWGPFFLRCQWAWKAREREACVLLQHGVPHVITAQSYTDTANIAGGCHTWEARIRNHSLE